MPWSRFVAIVSLAACGCGRFGYAVVDGGQDGNAVDVPPAVDVVDVAVDAPIDVPGTDATDATDAGCPPVSSASVCTTVGALSHAPVIDGVLECGLSLEDWTPVAWTGSVPIPSGVHAQYAVAWRPDGLYVFVAVHGETTRVVTLDPPNVYCGDSVEVYVDDDGRFATPGLYDTMGSVQVIAVAPQTGMPSQHLGTRYRDQAMVSSWPSTSFGTWSTSDGYVFEALVTAADLQLSTWTLASGGTIGLDLAINIGSTSGGSCPRLGQFFIHVLTPAPTGTCGGLPFCDTRAFCLPRLM